MAKEFLKPWFVLCEGAADVQVFQRLVERCNLSDKFDVDCPPSGATGGRAGFAHYMRSVIDASSTFRNNVKAVLIVSDNDDDLKQSLDEVKAEVRKMSPLPVPANERTVAKAAGQPSVVILMVPFDS